MRVGQEKITCSTIEVIGSTITDWIKQVMVSEKGVNSCGEEPLGLDENTKNDEGPICKAIEEVIGKPTMVVEERLLVAHKFNHCLLYTSRCV